MLKQQKCSFSKSVSPQGGSRVYTLWHHKEGSMLMPLQGGTRIFTLWHDKEGSMLKQQKYSTSKSVSPQGGTRVYTLA